MTNKFIISSLLGTGSLGVAITGGYYLFKNQTKLENPTKSKISSLITSSGRTLIGNDVEGLEIKFNIYNSSIKSLGKITLSKNTKEGIKKWCNDNLDNEIEISKKDEENSYFKIALKLYTKPTNREKLQKNSKTIAEEEDWTQKETTYKSKGEGDANIPTIKDKTKVTGIEIKNWCDINLDNEILDSGNIYDLLLKWCTKN